jgi:hypothetical protein
LRPTITLVTGAVIAMATALVATKYQCRARLARSDELPPLGALRPPTESDEETVEEFPLGSAGQPVVAEFANWPGYFTSAEQLIDPRAPATQDPHQAATLTGTGSARARAAARPRSPPACASLKAAADASTHTAIRRNASGGAPSA